MFNPYSLKNHPSEEELMEYHFACEDEQEQRNGDASSNNHHSQKTGFNVHVFKHLKECEQCQKQYARLKSEMSQTRQLFKKDFITCPDRVVSQVMSHVRNHPVKASIWTGKSTSYLWAGAIGLAAILLLVFLFQGVGLFYSSPNVHQMLSQNVSENVMSLTFKDSQRTESDEQNTSTAMMEFEMQSLIAYGQWESENLLAISSLEPFGAWETTYDSPSEDVSGSNNDN